MPTYKKGLLAYTSVSQPFKSGRAPDNPMVVKVLIFRIKFHLYQNICGALTYLGSTSSILSEQLWSLKQWLRNTGLHQSKIIIILGENYSIQTRKINNLLVIIPRRP